MPGTVRSKFLLFKQKEKTPQFDTLPCHTILPKILEKDEQIKQKGGNHKDKSKINEMENRQ